ncbi:MAG: sugar phosphate nucleotidyltransferase, partial [Planctomycetota bacterium]
EQLSGHPRDNVVGEPAKRDTAPCIGLAAALISAQDPEAVMAVMPSDHVISTDEQFCGALRLGHELIEQDPERIITFGIKPTYPAESFGYIQRGEAVRDGGEGAVYRVDRFREKPDQSTAEAYLQSGDFYWNSGIFLWKATTILSALKASQPEMFGHLEAIADAISTDEFDKVLDQEFHAIKGTSIDYAVMESYPNVVVIEAPFHWDDVGSWQSLGRLHPSDASQNTVVGDHIGIDTTGTIIYSDGDHTIVTIDVHDLIVVQTKDATLVAPKAAEERVREAVKQLEASGRTQRL